MSPLAPILQGFFTDPPAPGRPEHHLPPTVTAVASCWNASRATGIAPYKLDLADLNAR